MNNSKKLRPKKVKEVKMSEKPITSISKPWLITSIVLVVVLVGALLFDQLYEASLMTIDGKKYHMKDLSYYFYTVESGYNSYSQMFGTNYWDMTYDEEAGTTMRDAAKDDAVDTSLRSEILYNEAKAQGYSLTADEKKTISTSVKKLYDETLTDAVKKKNHFTKAYLNKIMSKTTLVSRFREDKIKEQKIDEAKIKEGVSYDEYKQYDIQYIYISTQTTDADEKTVDLSAEEKKAAYDKINAVYDKAKTTEDWSTLIPEEETDLKYKESNFTKSDTSYSDEFKAKMMTMANEDISEIYEDETGYYIVRMVNNNSSESYDNAVESAITTAENTAFDKVYEEIKAKHTFKLNDSAIKHLTMGTLTLAN